MKEIEDLIFTDDYMFGAVLQNEDICKKILELLLNIKIEKIEYPELQKKLKISYESHGIKLDVYIKDSDKIYDVEMQNNHFENIGKRSRFYQSMLDADNLLKGDRYGDLKESIIIFICKKDIFGKKRQSYTFENLCKDDPSLSLNDKTKKIIYNASGYNNEENAELRAFMKFITTNEPTDDFTNNLVKQVEKVKYNEIFRTEYLKMLYSYKEDLHYDAEELAKEIAPKLAKDMAKDIAKEMANEMAKEMAKELANEIAKAQTIILRNELISNFLKLNKLSDEEVAKCFNISVEQLNEIKETAIK